MPTIAFEGTELLDDATERLLATLPAGNYIFLIDIANLGYGGTLEVTINTKVRAASPFTRFYRAIYNGVATIPVKSSLPLTIHDSAEIRISRPVGISATYDWSVVEI